MPEFCLITTTETFLPSLVVGVRSADKFKTAALQEIVSAFTPHAQIRQSSEHKVLEFCSSPRLYFSSLIDGLGFRV
jgi:hypothetical protein